MELSKPGHAWVTLGLKLATISEFIVDLSKYRKMLEAFGICWRCGLGVPLHHSYPTKVNGSSGSCGSGVLSNCNKEGPKVIAEILCLQLSLDAWVS